MERTILLTLLAIGICTTAHAQSVNQEHQSFDRFIELDSTSMIMVPINWDNNAKTRNVKIMGNYRTKNILFYDPVTDYQKLLFQDSLQIILSYSGQLVGHYYKRDTIKQLNREFLYYTVINEDYDMDGKLATSDPSYLYQSKIDGTGLEQITPKSYHLKNYQYVGSSNVILAILISDDNGDKKFNSKDSEVLYKIDLSDISRSKIIAKIKLKENIE